MAHFPRLFSPLSINSVTVKNRIVSTGHHTHLAAGSINRRLIAYHEARAAGGVGLIIAEVAAVHASAVFSGELLRATSAECVDGYRALSDACHRHGAIVIGQLFHPGREVLSSDDGLAAVAIAPSTVPSERFHTMPRAMSVALIDDVIAGYARAAGYLVQGGMDGVEIVASHGYLPAQFLNADVNRRDDNYGGSDENRLRFLRGIVHAVRNTVQDAVIGLRISLDETGDDVQRAITALADDGVVDYYNITAGTSATLGGAVHIAPPMGTAPGYLAVRAAELRAVVRKPLLVAGRINQPHTAEEILNKEQADLCGMTRALLCDPQLPMRAESGQVDDIRACIGCNQSCIGRAHKGFGISCIQYPQAGRELEFGAASLSTSPKRVMVVGGGPGGMKAAVAAAERGHETVLFERVKQLGGQVLLAQRLPGREEFGGMVTNFARELHNAGVTVHTATEVTPAMVEERRPDVLILATGGKPYLPKLEVAGAHVVGAWEVLRGEATLGASVVVADWRGDWTGIGLAEMLAAAGSRVRLCVNSAAVGESLPQYTRNFHLARLHKLNVEMLTHLRLFGADEDTVFLQHTLSDSPVVLEGVDSVVVAHGNVPDTALEESLSGYNGTMMTVGDCLAPRTAEEAVLEGLRAAVAL